MPIIWRWFCNMSLTYLHIKHHFVTSMINDSSFYCLIIKITFVCRTGKKRRKTSQPSENTAAAFLFILCRRSNGNCPIVVNILSTCRETIRFWTTHFYMHVVSISDRSSTGHRPVTVELQPVNEHSPNSHRFVWTNCKVDKKAMIRNRYNRIPHPALNTKRGRDTYN